MLGTVSNLSALTVISNIATGIAGLATAFAAFYAYKSFQSWEERTKKLHRLEQSASMLREISRSHDILMFNLTEYCIRETKTNGTRLNHENSFKDGTPTDRTQLLREQHLDEVAKRNHTKSKFQSSLASYKTYCENYKALRGLRLLNVQSHKKIIEV